MVQWRSCSTIEWACRAAAQSELSAAEYKIVSTRNVLMQHGTQLKVHRQELAELVAKLSKLEQLET